MRTGRCLICHSDLIEILFSKNGFDLNVCRNCHLVFVPLPYSREELRQFQTEFYAESYFTGENDKKYGYRSDYFHQKRKERESFARRMLNRIEKQKTGKGTLLDIGCAAGYFLHIARNRGWSVSGIEMSPEAAAFGRRELGLDIQTTSFEEAETTAGSFDVITAWDVIEHIPDPKAFVKHAANLLKHDGLLILGTPNVKSFAARIRKENWKIFKPPEHLFYFSAESIQTLLDPLYRQVVTETIRAPETKVGASIVKKLKYAGYRAFDSFSAALNRSEYLYVVARR